MRLPPYVHPPFGRVRCQARAVAGSGEAAEDEAEEGVAVGALREGSRALQKSRVDEADRRPERDVLGQRKHQGEPALVDVDTPTNDVERNPEHGPVQNVQREPDGSPPAP